jgi:hypothetical protein
MRALQLLAAITICFIVTSPAVATDLPVIADTYTQSTTPNQNLGANGVISVSPGRISLVRFDANQTAVGTGSKAILKVKIVRVINSTNDLSANLVLGPWSEKTVTANTLPPISSSGLDRLSIKGATVGQILSFDVSAALPAWRSNPEKNFGIALVPGSPTPNLQFGAREAGSAAILSLSSGVVADNDVTVAVTGGDYADPV